VAPKRKPSRRASTDAGSLAVAERYARDAAEGYLVCSKQVQQAARRHLDDLSAGPRRGLRFDPAAGAHALEFFGFLHHSKGEWAGQRFTLEPWQQFIVWCLFGWKRADGTRRFRTAHVEVARKNGKSTLVAGVGLFLFFADGEPGAEVYCAATKRDQARIVFSEALRMRNSSPSLAKRIVKYHDNMNIPATASKFEPLGSDIDTLDGLNVHAAIVDELHAHKTRFVWDVLDTATASRRQPLMFAITTAGFDRESVCWYQHEYCEKVLDGIQADDSLFAFIAALDDDDEWQDETLWPKANPNLNVSVKLDDLRRKAHKAAGDPSALNSFLRLHLNRWTQTDVRWMPLDAWNACAGFAAGDPRELRRNVETSLSGRRCFGGLDLSSNTDLSAFVLIFPPVEDDGRYIALPTFWMPADNVRRRVSEDRLPYDVWIREGFINETPGNVVDYAFIRAYILRARDRFDIEEVAYDPWNALETATRLKDEGLTMVEVKQNFAGLSNATKELMGLVLGKRLAHLGNPVLRWMATNVVINTNEEGFIRPNRKKSREKIDGIVALIMALGRAFAHAPAASGDVSQGIWVL
jgi:phage terminase large subunit-like protein